MEHLYVEALLANCIRLRALDLSHSKIQTLPESIGELLHLGNLDLSQNQRLEGDGRVELPSQANTFIVGGKGIYSTAKQWFDGLEDLKAMNNLKGLLCIQFKWSNNVVKKVDGDVDTEEARRLMEELQPHSNLKQLLVSGYCGVRMPGWTTLLPNLAYILLKNCKELQYLPCLGSLRHLKSLSLSSLPKLEYIEISQSVFSSTPGSECAQGVSIFPSLERLHLFRLPKLKGWRDDFLHLEDNKKHAIMSLSLAYSELPGVDFVADKEKVVPVPKKRKETPANVQSAKGKKIKHVQEDSDEEEQVAFRQRIPPAKFMKHVIVGLPEAHKQAVRDVGFGSFLLLDLDSNKNSFCHELVARFNPDRASLQLPNREEIEVLPEDVHALIETQKDEDVTNEFIWNFIVAAINCCVRSTSRSTLNFKFLYCCENVSQIKTYDWCTYTFENLINSVAEWKEGAAYFTGPLPFLMVMYFDRLKRGTAQPRRTIPLIAVWNKQMIQERMKVEKKRGFGQGKVLDRLTAINTNSGEENQGPSSSSAPEDVKGFILDEFNNISKELTGHVQSMYALIDKAYKLIEEVDIPDEMKELIRNVWGKYTSVQPTMSSQGINTPGFLSQDENLFHEPAFLSELSDVMNKAWPNYNLFVGSQALPPTPPAKGKSLEQEESPTKQHLE
ncbi:uncharacterized protein LOC110737532 [Chenopodium quinoa]|uniref:uncharacterized protein LOC110737532 n=1 Tax=Chenopodium quinoa TaxID=63459 RepID=UPI000B793559|nr:uncharacterized protein LOC110737532 [Chenopodium quinoa]